MSTLSLLQESQRLSELSTRFGTFFPAVTKQLQKSESESVKLREQIKTKNRAFETTQTEVNTLKTENVRLKSKLKKAEKRIQNLEKKLNFIVNAAYDVRFAPIIL